MTDTQMFTIAIAIIFPLTMLLYSNSRITDVRSSVTEAKETLRAEMKTMSTELRAEMTAQFLMVNNKLDHLLEIVTRHEQKLDKK